MLLLLGGKYVNAKQRSWGNSWGASWLDSWGPQAASPSSGGGSGTAGSWKDIPWGERAPDYDIYTIKHPTLDVAIYAAATGMI